MTWNQLNHLVEKMIAGAIQPLAKEIDIHGTAVHQWESNPKKKKRLLWFAKQKIEHLDYQLVWTNSSQIYARENSK